MRIFTARVYSIRFCCDLCTGHEETDNIEIVLSDTTENILEKAKKIVSEKHPNLKIEIIEINVYESIMNITN